MLSDQELETGMQAARLTCTRFPVPADIIKRSGFTAPRHNAHQITEPVYADPSHDDGWKRWTQQEILEERRRAR